MSTRPCPWDGVAIQVYRSKVPGDTADKRRDWCRAHLDEAAAVGVSAIVWHGFSEELTVAKFEPLAAIAKERGLVSLAAYGMDDTDVAGKATRIALVSRHPLCAGIVFDWEGRWEDEPDTDPAKAQLFADTYSRLGADKWRCDQPWWKPTVHKGSPWRQFAGIVDARFRQNYCNDYEGKDRYERTNAGSDAAYAWMYAPRTNPARPPIIPPQDVRPVFNSRQGYGWRDIPSSLEHMVSHDDPVIIWSEPWPDAQVMQALKDRHALRCSQR